MKKWYCVKNRTLLLIAGVIWLIAGFNVARLGVISYGKIDFQWYWPLLSVVVFCAFGAMFYRMTVKHTKRICGYADDHPFWCFFDLKAYVIMVIMMGGGIGLRAAHLVPDFFVAFFYTGLGCALGCAGIIFLIRFARYKANAPIENAEVKKEEKGN